MQNLELPVGNDIIYHDILKKTHFENSLEIMGYG